MTRLTIPHNDTPPAAAQKLIDQLWHLTADDSKQDIDYDAIDSSALQELRIWADAQYEQLTDENSSNHARLQTARNLLPIAKILAKIGQCPDTEIERDIRKLTLDIKVLREDIQTLSRPFSDFYSAESPQILHLKDVIRQIFVQPEPMLQTIDALQQKSADEGRALSLKLRDIYSLNNVAASLVLMGQVLAPNSSQVKLKRYGDYREGSELFHALVDITVNTNVYRYKLNVADLSASLTELKQRRKCLTASPAFLKQTAWLYLNTKAALIKRTASKWGPTYENLWAPKARRTEALAEALVKAQGDLLYADYLLYGSDRTAHKIVARELARMAEAAAQAKTQAAPAKPAPLKPDTVNATRLRLKPSLAPHL